MWKKHSTSDVLFLVCAIYLHTPKPTERTVGEEEASHDTSALYAFMVLYYLDVQKRLPVGG